MALMIKLLPILPAMVTLFLPIVFSKKVGHENRRNMFRMLFLLLVSLSWVLTIEVRYRVFGSDIWGEMAVIENTILKRQWDVALSQYHSYYTLGGFIFIATSFTTLTSIPLLESLKVIQMICLIITASIIILMTRRIIQALEYHNGNNLLLLAALLPLLYSPLQALCVTKAVLSITTLFMAIMLLIMYHLLRNMKTSFITLFLITLSLPLVHITSSILLILIILVSASLTTFFIYFKRIINNDRISREVAICLKVLLITLFALFINTVLVHLYITTELEHYTLMGKYTLTTLFSLEEAAHNQFAMSISNPTLPLRFYLLIMLYLMHMLGVLIYLVRFPTKDFNTRATFKTVTILMKILIISTLLLSLPFLIISRLAAGLYPDRVLMFHFVLGGFLADAVLVSGIIQRNRDIAKILVLLVSLITLITTFLWPANLLLVNTSVAPIKLRDLRFIDNTNYHVYITAEFAYRFIDLTYFQYSGNTNCRTEIYIDQYTYLPFVSFLISNEYPISLLTKERANLAILSNIDKFTGYYVFGRQLFNLSHTLIEYSTGGNVVYNTEHSFIAVLLRQQVNK